MNELAQAAIDYLGRGHHLLALHGKRPNPRYHSRPDPDSDEPGWSWEKSIHGVPDTIEEANALKDIFEDPTTTGVAILIPEHNLVADVDTDEAATLFLELGGHLDDTVCAKTTKGYHVWYLAPGAAASVWLGGRTLLFKGFGGYVAAPPSRHFTDDTLTEQDGVYTWISDFDEGIGDLPDEMRERIRISHALDTTREQGTKAGPSIGVGFTAGRFDGRLWAEWPLDGLCKAIREAPDGNQNNMIAWAAMQARDEGVPYEVAMPKLLQASIDGGHPKHRALTTIRGAYKRRSRG